jgi:TonB family protein
MILAVMLAVAVQSAPATAAKPAGDPGAWIMVSDYPPAALRARQTGAVRFELRIDAAGRPTDCAILESSGSADLDRQTCALMGQRARFSPALDAGGKPVASTWASRVRWALPAEAPPVPATVALPNTPQKGMAASMLTVSADGIVEKCEPVQRTYWNVPAPADLCSTYRPGERFSAPTTRNGHPQRRRVKLTISTEDLYIN